MVRIITCLSRWKRSISPHHLYMPKKYPRSKSPVFCETNAFAYIPKLFAVVPPKVHPVHSLQVKTPYITQQACVNTYFCPTSAHFIKTWLIFTDVFLAIYSRFRHPRVHTFINRIRKLNQWPLQVISLFHFMSKINYIHLKDSSYDHQITTF